MNRTAKLLAWGLYFPNDENDIPNDPRIALCQAFEGFFRRHEELFHENEVSRNLSIWIDHSLLRADVSLISRFGPIFDNNPIEALDCISIGYVQKVGLIRPFDSRKIHARIYNHEPVTPLKNLKSNSIGKFITIKGTVIRVSIIKPLISSMVFTCAKCDSKAQRVLKDGKYNPPEQCPMGGCKSTTFHPDRSSAKSVDWQKIKIQEILGDDQREAGRMPRNIECELTEDLVDSCVPGDMVTVSGIVKVVSSDGDSGRSKTKSLFLLYIDANAVVNSKQVEEGKMELLQFTTKDLYGIREIACDSNPFRLVVNSVCPSIFGHEVVKAGLVLALFGGVQKSGAERNKISTRGDIHVLVVGDPGLGKSQMLQAISNLAPRGVYVCGNTTTGAGLTVTVLKDPISGDFALEAGALVLGDQGCCCIDEFDKMGSEHPALLEAMEQQSVSVAKAGIVCNLLSRTAIIAAANPCGGHYDRSKTVHENLRMGSAILSRFDIVFILLDKPDTERDEMLSDHVMALHSGKHAKKQRTDFDKTPLVGPSKKGADEKEDIKERLRVPPGSEFAPIPITLLRKYIGYARKYVHPKLSEEAKVILCDFYLSLRRNHHSMDSTPITTRQLESLIRLAEARAKIELREIVTRDDALDVVDLMKESLIDTLSDDMGNVDFKRSTGMSKRKQLMTFVSKLQKVSEVENRSSFSTQELKMVAESMHLPIPDFEQFLENLNNEGYILKKGPQQYRLMTSSANYQPTPSGAHSGSYQRR